MADALGFLGFATNVAGNLMLASKSSRGWIVRIVSNLLWFSYGLADASAPNVANAVTFLGINVYGFMKWKRGQL